MVTSGSYVDEVHIRKNAPLQEFIGQYTLEILLVDVLGKEFLLSVEYTDVDDVVVVDVVYFESLIGQGRYRYLGVRWVDVYVTTVTYIVVEDDMVFFEYVAHLSFFFDNRNELNGIKFVFCFSELKNVSLDGLDGQAILVDLFDMISGRI